MTTPEIVTHYLKVISFVVFAIYNGLLTFIAYEKGEWWKTVFSALTTAIFMALIWNWFWPIF